MIRKKEKTEEKKDEVSEKEEEKERADEGKEKTKVEDDITNLPSESDGEKKISVFESESDADNMHGGNDPDNIIHGGDRPSSRLVKIGVKPGQPHEGSIASIIKDKTDIELNNINLNSQQITELGEHLEKSDDIKTISLRNVQLDNYNFSRLAESIKKSPSDPVMLNFNLNKITAKSADKLVEVLKEKQSVEIVLLHGNPLGSDGVKIIVDGLLPDDESTGAPPSGCKIKELDIGDTTLGDSGVEEIARLLESNTDLKTLNMNGNPAITVQGWKRLGKSLKKNKNLTHLTLDFNKIGDEGLSALVKGLKDNLTLKSLDLEDTGLTEDGGKKIVELLKSNTTILDITVSPGNMISDKTQDEIRNYLSLNKTSLSSFNPFKAQS